jgi:hypothetical protein
LTPASSRRIKQTAFFFLFGKLRRVGGEGFARRDEHVDVAARLFASAVRPRQRNNAPPRAAHRVHGLAHERADRGSLGAGHLQIELAVVLEADALRVGQKTPVAVRQTARLFVRDGGSHSVHASITRLVQPPRRFRPDAPDLAEFKQRANAAVAF